MHNIYPLARGDPLCPLGFHPQVRWPTRCKRCFRDYKEHGGKKREEPSLRRDSSTASTPSLSLNLSDGSIKRNWVSSSNLAAENGKTGNSNSASDQSNPSSWVSTSDLANLQDDMQAVPTVSIKLPPKRKQKPLDTGQRTVSDSFSIIKERTSPMFNKSDSLSDRVRKFQASKTESKRIQVKELKTVSEDTNNHDVQKRTKDDYYDSSSSSDHDDTLSNAGTETTDTTLVGIDSELKEQLDSLKAELETTKTKCDRLEREKSDILLRRLAAMETTTSKTTATEVLKLQQKCNEMQQQLEDCRDERRSLTLRVKELEADLDLRPTVQEAQKIADELRSKLLAAETVCEELMDENEDMKKELRDMEEQLDEMQDNFREDQAVEYTSIKKELDQTTKNCRILSFKLRKAERKVEQLEAEKVEMDKKMNEISGGAGGTLTHLDRIKQLEQDLKVANEVSLRLQKELEESNRKLEESTKTTSKKTKAPPLGVIGKSSSGEGQKVSRASLTRGGSQDDPAQLLRDLQDSLEREADLREQLKFAEEEAENLRKKVSRIEEDNESLVLQLKKMATKARSRKLSPTNQRLTPDSKDSKNQSDDDNLEDLKLQLELSEQEASVLRKKIEESEADNRRLKVKVKDLQDKLITKGTSRKSLPTSDKGDTIDSQKIKILEDETTDLRKKLIEKERDCERLHAELTLNQKRSKSVQKSKSLDLDQQTLDLKRQLQLIEQEASILRSKVQSLESECEKLTAENKKLSLLKSIKGKTSEKSVEKYMDRIAALEVELNESKQVIRELQGMGNGAQSSSKVSQGDFKKFSSRTPKKVSALTSRDQLKTMVSDLEKEISEILMCMKTSENEKIKLEEELKRLKENSETGKALDEIRELYKKFGNVEKYDDEKSKKSKLARNSGEMSLEISKIRDVIEKATIEKNEAKEQLDKVNKEHKKTLKERLDLENKILDLQNKIKIMESDKQEAATLNKKINNLQNSLDEKDSEINNLKKGAAELVKLSNEVSLKDKKITDLESRVEKFETKYTECNKKLKEHSKEFDSKLEKEKQKLKDLEDSLSKMEDEKRKVSYQAETLNTKIKGYENTINQKDKLIKQLEESLAKEREVVSKTNLKIGELEGREISKLKSELSKKNVVVSELESKLEMANKNQQNLQDKIKKSEAASSSAQVDLEKKIKELQIDLQNEKKKVEILKANAEKEHKNREQELIALKTKIKQLEANASGGGVKRELDFKHFQESIEKLENTITKERQKYDDLTAKYEILEEEHVVTKAKLVMEKETLENQFKNLKKDQTQLETELRTLRDTYTSHQDGWIKEKLELEQKVKDLSKINYNGNDIEKQRLKALFEEKQSELEQVKKEYELIHDQMEYMRRENDELKRKLDDYEKVNKVQRNISADSSAMEQEIRQLRIKLNNADKGRKADVGECKMRYEAQLSVVNQEIQSLQNQVLRFKRERDNYKHMLETAQKTMGELKHSPRISRGAGHDEKKQYYDELEESKSKVANLEQQISCMEDELSEARLESSRLKTELISEKSSWEVRLSELHSKVNELEEEKVLNSGRTKIMGLRTRMELAWQKEREEQQRLLQETATLARDLRQTLFEVERERDKERLEAKRKQDQYKKTSEEEQEETKRKLTELQCDLLELRDAHAKLRTTNEKLRREKERFDKERESFRLSRLESRKYEDDSKVERIIEQVDILKQVAPELFFSKDQEAPYTPTPPRRTKSKSRETSPVIGATEPSQEDKQQQIQRIMLRLVNTTEDLRKIQKFNERDIERERIRKMGMRRATSTEAENVGSARYGKTIKKQTSLERQGSLQRKSLSLEHNIQADQNIWRSDDYGDSLSSLQSFDGEADKMVKRDSSLDSRLSGGSTQSDVGDKKKKKSLMGKLKKLTKSRSIDDQDPGTFSEPRNLSSKSSTKNNSNSDVNEEKGSKSNLKERISGIFRRSGSSSRSNSQERRETSSTQRPLIRNGTKVSASSSNAS
ncbi:restin homolog isoform X2 [Anthonomus grandis grandis]|uniref:restin homolog isoform X2 n=1 Tax=Anthonomus grandis grandis TaxID=2921223 RepID=UPI00216585C0|nr:restin homolog isoform X2 [Anthonomus grandis grandis]